MNSTYISGSTAIKLDYDVYEDNAVLKEKKTYRHNRRHKVKVVLSLLIIIAAALVLMLRFALITSLGYSISNSEKKYEEIRNMNSVLRYQIEKETDLDNIRLLAEAKLGMQTPKKNQIVYINVPKNDYTIVINENGKNKNDLSFLKAFINEGKEAAAALIAN